MTRRVALAGLLALALATNAQATFIVYTSQASYLAALASNPFKDTYNDLTPGNSLGTTLSRNGNGFSYMASDPNKLFGAGTAADAWLSTGIVTDSIVYNTFSSNVRGVGGFFFGSNIAGSFLAGVTVNFTAVDATQTLMQSLTNTTTSTFFGVISNGPITSFTVGVTQPLLDIRALATANDFIVGATPTTTGVPTPPTLLLGLVGAGVTGVARLRRRGASVEPRLTVC
jgi:hypothetical protein